MAMCGLMLPVAENSSISVYKKVLVDIGDEQSIEQSLSTFSAHMTNIVSIIEEADSDSLVLIDELGSGTDPVEGAALAISIMERLAMYGAKVGATTHYAEIKEYALQTPGVCNASCEFDVETPQADLPSADWNSRQIQRICHQPAVGTAGGNYRSGKTQHLCGKDPL